MKSPFHFAQSVLATSPSPQVSPSTPVYNSASLAFLALAPLSFPAGTSFLSF